MHTICTVLAHARTPHVYPEIKRVLESNDVRLTMIGFVVVVVVVVHFIHYSLSLHTTLNVVVLHLHLLIVIARS
jgi:hypothetical protein